MTSFPEAIPRSEPTPLAAATIPEAFQQVVATYGDQTALRTIDEHVSYTWRELDERVRSLAAGLAGLGLGRGDTVAIILPNTVECHLVDYAAYHIGAVPFAVFNSSPAEQIEHQLRVADCTLVVTQLAFLDKVRAAVAALGDQVRHLVVVDGEVPGTLTLEDLEGAADPAFDVEAAWRAVRADDLSTLIFTSGTTGAPKGAQWSHRTVMAQQRALAAALPLPSIGIISFLPMAHAGGRITSQYMALAHGAAITACPDMAQVPVALARHRPDAFFSVPRLWEKLQVAIELMIAGEADDSHRGALQAALETGKQAVLAAETGSDADPAEVIRLLTEHKEALTLLRPLLGRLGLDRIKAAFVGGAPSASELSVFFRAVGVPMLEAYGLTEGSLNVFNRIEDFKAGTAGKPLPGVELKLGDDGELLAKADLNFVGYRKQPDETAAALDENGWLRTGDIAVIDDDGFVSIVDRKKEIIINSAGKNMSPATIESTIKGESSLIGQLVAVGDRRKYVTALVTLDPEALAVYAKRLGLDGKPESDIVAAPEVRAEVEAAVERGNRRLNSNEQIKKFAILATAWLPDSEELTPTAKLKRRVIHRKYAEQIEALYFD
ncbi:AMP-dependent synthetase/ligase [Rhodococcus sp. T7]|uniref:AMP-dependent synthetase/ligase n=1 Tax=Rhodococcus sp. T7 TaxID=627444 RepID=UPI001357865A|nr:AMP-dependent synthetase/ligase [Rhodococcus sp. T7]KAF0957007.1 Long-chain-fatty-acid--CoA ligase FadD15 [Rhodococcus sp. T7]KAF0958712.1 Long-chain-fatty-acid--CoA ligase FadD15 [Rhodococcus sp. T7]